MLKTCSLRWFLLAVFPPVSHDLEQVDGGHRALLDSSSSEGESSEEEVVFTVNRRTGEWEGEEARGLLAGRRRRRSSSGSSSLGPHSEVSRDLIRLSTDEEEEEEMMVKVG